MFRIPMQQKFPNLGRVTVPFGGKTAYENFHPALDVANVKGTPVPATGTGVIEQTVAGKQQGDSGYGNLVSIRTPNGDKHQLGHMENVNVRPGQKVQAGQLVGTMGNSGSAYSPSGRGDGTHLDVRITNAYGKYKNPYTYMKNFVKM